MPHLPSRSCSTSWNGCPAWDPKSAQRIAYWILNADRATALRLSDAIAEVKDTVRFCSRCFNYAEGRRVRHLRLEQARPKRHLRGQRATRHPAYRAHCRLLWRVSRAGWRAFAHGGHRSRTTCASAELMKRLGSPKRWTKWCWPRTPTWRARRRPPTWRASSSRSALP